MSKDSQVPALIPPLAGLLPLVAPTIHALFAEARQRIDGRDGAACLAVAAETEAFILDCAWRGWADDWEWEKPAGECSVDVCGEAARLRGLCRLHYGRWRAHGDANWSPPTANERFASLLDRSGDCWVWQGRLDADGYGSFSVDGRTRRVHRWWYDLQVGIPRGLELDHLCRNRACVRLTHLEPVTHAENVRRGAAARAEARLLVGVSA